MVKLSPKHVEELKQKGTEKAGKINLKCSKCQAQTGFNKITLRRSKDENGNNIYICQNC